MNYAYLKHQGLIKEDEEEKDVGLMSPGVTDNSKIDIVAGIDYTLGTKQSPKSIEPDSKFERKYVVDEKQKEKEVEKVLGYLWGGNSYARTAIPTCQFRWCARCNQIKPPRAHHCSTCNKCILKMDHHCPWVGTCVGYDNHKLFIQFMVYVCIGCLYAAIATGVYSIRSYGDLSTKEIQALTE